MHITLAAIGKSKDSAFHTLTERYITRCGWRIQPTVLDAKKNLSGTALQAEEGRLLLEATQSAHIRIALDERGKNLTSPAFAQQIQQWQLQGHSHLAFLIGGADGHSDDTRRQCQFALSLGAMVWPHQLVRVMLCEQLYRAYSILNHHPYHRD